MCGYLTKGGTEIDLSLRFSDRRIILCNRASAYRLHKLTPARILDGLRCFGVILGGFGIYKPIIDFAGAGATVPLTGFGYLLADGVRKAVDENGILGILTGGLTSAAAGITAALFFGLAAALAFKSKPE